MKALLCNEPGRLTVVSRPVPVRAEGEVLVRIRHVGICGTDFHIFAGKHPFLEYPRVMGHELSGNVEEAPAGSALSKGDPVYIVPYLSCGTCQACRRGLTNACRNIQVLGVHCDGGMAEYISVPEKNVVPTGNIPLADAAMIEFLAIGAHGVKRGNIVAEDRVLVTGSGPIGMSAIIFAKARGAHVTVMDTREDRLAFAVDRLGADATIFASDQAEAEAARQTGDDWYDVVVDATGNAIPMQRGFNFLAHGARYVLLSVVRQDITFSDPEFHKREMTVKGSRNATRADFERVIAAIESGQVPLDKLITHRTSLAGAITDLPRWASEKRGLVKALVELG
jgi:2-desacetyl-2-hydroxyethyl bacteriochlorophyllide A dehydrogenase